MLNIFSIFTERIQSEIESLSSDSTFIINSPPIKEEPSAQLFCGEHETVIGASSALDIKYKFINK